MNSVLRHNASYWESQNVILKNNQLGFEVETGYLKKGDGFSGWNELDYITKNTVKGGITAYAGGGQANAVVICAETTFIETVATTNDSIKLNAAGFGKVRSIFNYGANDLKLYPLSGERFQNFTTLMAIDDPIVIASANAIKLFSEEEGIWRF